jgi:choline dehydrogenase-like flavoprotein
MSSAEPRTAGAVVTGRAWLDEAGGHPLELTCDAVVVGSGAGGAVVAAELAEAGLDVIVLEEGGHHTTEEFTADSTAMTRLLYRDGAANFARGRPRCSSPRAGASGGSTTVNGAMSWRTPERVLDRWAREDGLEPVSDRYFDRVERCISASPQDPGSIGRDNELLREGAERLGMAGRPEPARPDSLRGVQHVHVRVPDGRQAVGARHLRAARRGVRRPCPRGLPRGHGRVRGSPGRRRRRPAHGPRRAPLPGAGRARPSSAPAGSRRRRSCCARGFGSESGRLGRNLSMHPNAKVIAFFDEEVKGFHGAHQGYQVREFEARAWCSPR